MVMHSSILAWRIPWIEELGGLSPGGRKDSDMTAHVPHAYPFRNPLKTLRPVFLSG